MEHSLDFYLFNIKLGCGLVDRLRRAVAGLDYYRCLEYPLVYNSLAESEGDTKMLDVGSGHGLFPLFLTINNYVVYATDIDPEVISKLRSLTRRLNIPPDRPVIEKQDARKLTCPDNFFDQVACISTIEHLRETGDIEAIREMARVLVPGGILLLTVPFSQTYEENETSPHVDYFERRYDKETIKKRLIEPSQLKLKKIQYFGHKGLRFGDYWYRLPRMIRGVFGWTAPFFSGIFLSVLDAENEKRIDGAFIALEKP